MKRKLKVGDVVVINNPKDSWGGVYYVEKAHGEIGIVESINGSRIGVRHKTIPPSWSSVNNHTGSRACEFYYSESELIKIGVL